MRNVAASKINLAVASIIISVSTAGAGVVGYVAASALMMMLAQR